ncbi:MAG: HAMP domain-containing histidine kinase [Nitrospirae bacterium]|nr:HAMP domain-containing histidine kinase [Nitrospirota bacterium]
MHLTDNELIEELKRRFEENGKALYDLKIMTRKLEKVNKKLQESEALKGNFLSNIKNEINNPLTSILGLTEQLFGSCSLDCTNVEAIARLIHLEAFSLDFQMRNIFAAAELESGEATLGISLVDVVSLAESTIESFKAWADERSIEVRLYVQCREEPLQNQEDEEDEMCFFKTDAEKLRLVLANLLANAIEFSSDGSAVDIHINREQDRLIINIRDYGIGIDVEDQEIIFDRFRQVETGTTKTHRGHGLGLSITRAVAELLSGDVTLESTKGKGSVFTIDIPESGEEVTSDAFSADGNEFIFEDESEF